MLPTDDVANDIQALRQKLPASPYRDDVPHSTLLRGITSKSNVPDDALVRKVDAAVSISKRLPLIARVQSVTNMSNQFYTDSGVILLQASPELLTYRQETASLLAQNDYQVEAQELDVFMPHITIRLGVALEGALLEEAEALFKDRTITFGRWLLFRLAKEGNKRRMHQVWPSFY